MRPAFLRTGKSVGEAFKRSCRTRIKKDKDESEFPSGSHAWMQYPNHNQRYPGRAVNNDVQGEIRTYFITGTAGRIIDPILIRCVEVSLDDMALSLLVKSPDWIPASQKGRKHKKGLHRNGSLLLLTPYLNP
jgi:hypothetical protein